MAVLPARKDHTPAEGIAALPIDEARVAQPIERIALGDQMAPQVSAGSIADAEFFEEGGVVQSALLEIVDRFRMPVELELVEGRRLFQHGATVGCRNWWLDVLLEIRDIWRNDRPCDNSINRMRSPPRPQPWQ